MTLTSELMVEAEVKTDQRRPDGGNQRLRRDGSQAAEKAVR
jgi:hypothetical protein